MDLDIIPKRAGGRQPVCADSGGFNILYRFTNVFNFAQGDLVMLGAMAAASACAAGLPWFAALLAAAALVGIKRAPGLRPRIPRDCQKDPRPLLARQARRVRRHRRIAIPVAI